MDFRTARPIGERIEQMKGRCGSGCTGYDNAFIYDMPHNARQDIVTELTSPSSGIKWVACVSAVLTARADAPSGALAGYPSAPISPSRSSTRATGKTT